LIQRQAVLILVPVSLLASDRDPNGTRGGICVSTVSIVGVCGAAFLPGADQIGPSVVVAELTGRSRPQKSPAGGSRGRPDTGVIPTDAADGADSIFDPSRPVDSASRSAFTTERNVDPQCPQERLRAM
jgi:hypothetical protein